MGMMMINTVLVLIPIVMMVIMLRSEEVLHGLKQRHFSELEGRLHFIVMFVRQSHQQWTKQ